MISGKVAEWSKALVLGFPPYTSLKGRGFESHPCQLTFFLAFLSVFLVSYFNEISSLGIFLVSRSACKLSLRTG